MISQSEQLRHFSSNYLNLIILPTEACNFRCTYCYETFENKKMPRPVLVSATGMSALCQKRTHAAQQNCGIFTTAIFMLERIRMGDTSPANKVRQLLACIATRGFATRRRIHFRTRG